MRVALAARAAKRLLQHKHPISPVSDILSKKKSFDAIYASLVNPDAREVE